MRSVPPACHPPLCKCPRFGSPGKRKTQIDMLALSVARRCPPAVARDAAAAAAAASGRSRRGFQAGASVIVAPIIAPVGRTSLLFVFRLQVDPCVRHNIRSTWLHADDPYIPYYGVLRSNFVANTSTNKTQANHDTWLQNTYCPSRVCPGCFSGGAR